MRNYLVIFLILGLLDSWTVTWAQNQTFVLGDVEMVLGDISAGVDVYYRSMRLNRSTKSWNVDLVISNKTSQALRGPFLFVLTGFTNTSGPLFTDGHDGANSFYDITTTVNNGTLQPAEQSQRYTLSLGISSGSPKFSGRIYARGPPFSNSVTSFIRTLDEVGQRLPSVEISEVGPAGQFDYKSDPVFGVSNPGKISGQHVWRFHRDGYLPVWREADLAPEKINLINFPRLTRRNTNSLDISTLQGGSFESGNLKLRFSSGAVGQDIAATVTRLNRQSLPALLPLGWSPIEAFWIELSAPMPISAEATLDVSAQPLGESAVVLTRWSETNLQWEVMQSLVGGERKTIDTLIKSGGAYAVVVADVGVTAPPVSPVGQALRPTTAASQITTGLTAGGYINPASSPASITPELVTATAQVLVTNQGRPLPSGLQFSCDIVDKYQLNDRSSRHPPTYQTSITGYQYPGDKNPDTLAADFPVRPSLIYGSGQLAEGVVHVDILGPDGFTAGVFDANGGEIVRDGLRILAGVGTFDRQRAAQLRSFDPALFADLVDSSFTNVAAFELAVDGLSAGRKLNLQFTGAPTNAMLVLGRIITDHGFYGIEPCERLISDDRGRLTSLEPLVGEHLPGLKGSGQYILLRSTRAQGLIEGVARNSSGQPAAGLAVQASPWLTFSATNGFYQLLAPTGTVKIAMTDLSNGDTGASVYTVADTDVVTRSDISSAPTGPRVVSVIPTNNAFGVSRVTPVVVSFSEQVNPQTLLSGGLQLIGSNGVAVTAGLSLDLAGKSATLLPLNPLPGRTLLTVRLSTNISDFAGNRLEGASQFTFTTETDALNRSAAQLIIYEPTNGFAPVFGTPGSADPESPVILVNENSGETATILSKPDGSFTNFISAGVDDFISAVLVNQNGTRTTLPASRQIFRDGSVGLFKGGGILAAESDGGPMQVIVEPGAIQGKTKFKIQSLDLLKLQAALDASPTNGAILLGGFSMSQDGDELNIAPDFVFPIDAAQLGLPAGVEPTNASFALATPVELDDGTRAYEIVDRMHYENGALVTHSPPFVGALLKKLYKSSAAGKKLKLSNKILGALGLPGIQETIMHQLFLPLMLAQGTSVTVHGIVKAAQFDANGDVIPGTEKRVPGAVVTLSSGGVQPGRVGRVNPGGTFATSDEQGKYSFLVPINLIDGPANYLLTATHPAFYPQQAAGGATLQNMAQRLQQALLDLNLGVAVDLYFPIIDTSLDLGGDTVGPKISFAQEPPDPSPGTNDADGVLVTVSASDDRDIASLRIQVNDYQPINPAITNFSSPTPQNQVDTNLSPSVKQTSFTIRSLYRASATIHATAADTSGNLREADYPILFAGDRSLPLITSNSAPPRLTFSWPVDGACGTPQGTPLILRFSSPLATNAADTVKSWLGMAGGLVLKATLSKDLRQVTVLFNGIAGETVTCTILPALVSENGKPFDQNPAAPGNQSHTISFGIATPQSQDLAGIEFGGGAVQLGAYVFVLERQGAIDGSVVAYDVSGSSPRRVGEISVPGYPRDLTLIPNYSFKLHDSGSCQTRDLLAVVGGKVGAETFQYLWVIDVSDPARLTRLAGTAATLATAALTKVKWSPPFLAYLESGADQTSVSLVTLQTFLLGMNATADEIASWPAGGVLGVDTNADGDFCDAGDVMPIPFANPGSFFGKDFAFAPLTAQRIQDFDFDSDTAMVSLVLSRGFKFNPNGTPDTNQPLPGAFVTAFDSRGRIDPAEGTLNLQSGENPKRVSILPSVLLQGVGTNAPTFRNLAVVSAQDNDGGAHRLVIIDVTDARHPVRLGQLDLTGYGIPQSLIRRTDGLLALATSSDLILIDPARLLLPSSPGSEPAALVGVIPGAGSGMRSFDAPPSGVNIVSSGGKNQVIRTSPSLRLLSFPTRQPFAAKNVVGLPPAEIAALLADGVDANLLIKAQLFKSVGTNPPALLAPNPSAHYYVRVDFLGSPARTTLDLVAESLNDSGVALPTGGSNALPSRLASSGTFADLGITNVSAFSRELKAYRLDNNAIGQFHQVYLAGPIVLPSMPLTTAQFQSVTQQLARALMRPGRGLWVGLDTKITGPDSPTNALSRAENRRLVPGTSDFASVSHVTKPLLVIPGIAGSHLENTSSWSSVILSERWPGYLPKSQEELTLDPSETQYPIAASDVIRQIPEDYNVVAGTVLSLIGVKKDIYEPLLGYLKEELGYAEYNYIKTPDELIAHPEKFSVRRTVAGMVAGEVSRGPNMFVFPYDWRLDIAKNAENLREYLKVVRTVQPEAEQIDIVAHSMGGLLARRFIIDNPGVVGRCVTIGTPFLGAPKAIAALETGDFDDAALNFIITKPLLKKLAEYFPAVHQLLPSKAYFDLGGQPLAEAGWDFDGDGLASEAYTYSNYTYVIDQIFHVKTNTFPVATNQLFHSYAAANDLGNKQDDWTQDSTGVDYFHIYGVQSVPKTIGQVRLARTLRPVEPPADLRLGLPDLQSTERDVSLPLSPPLLGDKAYVLYPRFDVVRVEGDGTVPALSASRLGPNGNLNAPGSRLLRLTSTSLTNDMSTDHNGMLANTTLLNWVGEILSGNEPESGNETSLPTALSKKSALPLARKPFVNVEIVNAVPGTAYAVETATGKSSLGQEVAGTPTESVKVRPFLPGEADADLNVQSIEFAIAGDNAYDLFFEASEQPISIIVRMGTGTEVTGKLIRRNVQFAAGTGVQVHVVPAAGTVAVMPPGNSMFPDQALAGADANNEQCPVLDETLDHDTTRITFNPFDDLTATNDITVFGAYDEGRDSDINTELIYRLPEQRVAVDSLESAPFYGMAMDSAGNLSEPKKVKRKQPQAIDCELLDAKRAAVLDVLKQGLEAVHDEGWLLDYQHVSILEQGSGACLWQPGDICEHCKEVYSPKESDHDYEVFLRVFINGAPPSFTADPHALVNRQGDWYFRPPLLVGGQWEYIRPDGTKLHQPGSAKSETPAQIITRSLNETVHLLGYDQPDPDKKWVYPLLPDISFFPVRFEHFTNALLDLEPPPPDGGDPIGDAGMGRQMLLLKWLLEGVYVPVTSPPIYAGEDLNLIFNRMKSRGDSGIPTFEGYEWGQLQLHAALGSGLMLRVENPRAYFDSEQVNRDFLYNLKRKQIKKAGKAAIRAALAQLAGSDEPDRAALLFSVDRALMASLNLKSFEEVIQFLAEQKPALFGPFSARLGDFVKAKLADQAFIDSLIADDCELNKFLADCMNLLFKVNADTLSGWQQSVPILSDNELFFRTNNLHTLRVGFPHIQKPGLTELLNTATVTLPVRLINDSKSAATVTCPMTINNTPTVSVTTNIPARSNVDFLKGPFTLTRTLTSSAPQPVILTVTSSTFTEEAHIANNWIGLESYILDLTDPCATIPIVIPPPSGLPPANPEATRIFRRNDYFDPGFKPAELAAKFEAAFGAPPERIYVVGSQMLGAADAASDIDVVFVTDILNPVTGERLKKEDDLVMPFFKAINPQIKVPASVKHLGNPAIDPEAADIGSPSPDPDPDIGARRLPKRGTLDPFFESIYEVNRFGFLVWP